MLFQTKETLSEHIVRILGNQHAVSAQSIHALLKKTRNCSIQAVYKELRKLQEGGVVVKTKKHYSLRIPWAIEFVSFANKIKRHYLEFSQLIAILPEYNKKEIWHFSNLLRLNDFWSQLLLLLIQQSKEKILYGWNPHLWFHLVQTKQEKQYIDSLHKTESKLYLVIGGDTYLDRWAEKFLDKRVLQYAFSKQLFSKKQPCYLNVIDDYVLTVKIDSETMQSIEKIYNSVHSREELDIANILEVFNGKARVSIWLENNPPKARLIRGKFSRFFGV